MSPQWVYLSYPLHPEAPFYGGEKGFSQHRVKQMDRGDSCNTQQWRLSNHAGTHIDFPYHFSPNGKTSDEYQAEFWIFEKICVIHLENVEPGTIITKDVLDVTSIPFDTELILLKTGYCDRRDSYTYWRSNPGLSPDLAEQIRRRCPDIRIFGCDLISISSYSHRDTGRLAHKAFLDHDQPILILEDMNLAPIEMDIHVNKVIVSPMHVLKSDGAPCTVFAEIYK